MFNLKISEDYIELYRKSPYRARIELICETLIRLRYLEAVIVQHVHEWIRFTNYCNNISIDIPQTIHSQSINKYIEWRLPIGSKSRRRFIKASVRMFIEADDIGNFSKRIHPPPKQSNALFNEWVPPYLFFLQQHRGVADKTLRKNILSLGEFTEFLEKRCIHDFNELKACDIHEFCIGRGSRKPITWASYLGMVRRFLKYVFLQNGSEKDLSFAVETARCYSHSGICDVLTKPEADKILDSVDRSSSIGRRDYAILLFAVRYGMRPSDIRQLCFENIQWRLGQIVFCQSKTGKTLTLPLLPDVAEALIGYIRSGRPLSDARNIFVRHKAPFEPFSPDNNLWPISIKALHSAELDGRSGAKGIYLFRHSLATNMLGANIPIKTIGDLLGHASINSTYGYTKVDLINLREASLSIAEVQHE